MHSDPEDVMALRLDFCSHDAARHAVLRWHYSHTMPAAKLVRIGVWEDGRFVGAILYGSGANRHLSRPFGLKPTEACELVRVAMPDKLKYVYPFSKSLRRNLDAIAEPFPKRAGSIDSDVPANQVGEGGAIPTSALHTSHG